MQKILTKDFTLLELLGGMYGYLLVDKGFDRIHELIEWVYGEPVFTHQIPSIADDFMAFLKKQFPKLNTPKVEKEVKKFVKNIKAKNQLNLVCRLNKLTPLYGNKFDVQPMQPFDKVEELELMTGIENKKVIVVSIGDEEFPTNM